MRIWGASAGVRLKDRVRWALRRLGLQPSPKHRARVLPLRYPRRVHAPVFGLDYYRVLAQSKVVLNRHIGFAGTDTSNLRLFEATGMGACLLTDRQQNLSELFEPDVEVATYDGIEECVEKANWLLANDEQRAAIAAAGQRRTLQDHSFERRVRTMAELVADQLPRRAA
jgi:hypothetical protein